MMRSFHRRVVLVPLLVLLVAAWVLAVNPLAGRKSLEVCAPEAIEELLERAKGGAQELLWGFYYVEMGLGSGEGLVEQPPCGWGILGFELRWRPEENYLGRCSITRAPPQG